MGDTSIKFEVIPGKNQKSEYVMTCGKHSVRGWCKCSRAVLPAPFLNSAANTVRCNRRWFCFCVLVKGKNKRVGKQLASQKILQMLHPHVKNWGSLLRMYGRENNKMVKKVFFPPLFSKHFWAVDERRSGFARYIAAVLFLRRKILTRAWSNCSSTPKRTSPIFTFWTNCKRRWGNWLERG